MKRFLKLSTNKRLEKFRSKLTEVMRSLFLKDNFTVSGMSFDFLQHFICVKVL